MDEVKLALRAKRSDGRAVSSARTSYTTCEERISKLQDDEMRKSNEALSQFRIDERELVQYSMVHND